MGTLSSDVFTSLVSSLSDINASTLRRVCEALFGAVDHEHREFFSRRTLLLSADGMEVRFLGVRLDQSDLDLWMEIVHLARRQIPGSPVTFSASDVLKALQRRTGKRDHEWLREAMARLAGAGIEITLRRRHTWFLDGFLSYRVNERRGRYAVMPSPPLLELFKHPVFHPDCGARQ
jgi:hypothetical protein